MQTIEASLYLRFELLSNRTFENIIEARLHSTVMLISYSNDAKSLMSFWETN